MDEITVRVSGMDLPHGVRAVSGAVADVAGVRVLTVDPASGMVRVGGDMDRRAVCDAIRAAGFQVTP